MTRNDVCVIKKVHNKYGLYTMHPDTYNLSLLASYGTYQEAEKAAKRLKLVIVSEWKFEFLDI